MCKKCASKSNAIELLPVLNSSGVFEKLVIRKITNMPATNFIFDGFGPMPTSIETDAAGNKWFKVQKNIKTDTSQNLHLINTPVVGVLEITETSLVNAGFYVDPETRIFIEEIVDGQPMNKTNIKCYTKCVCNWDGAKWKCTCHTDCYTNAELGGGSEA